MNPGQIIIKFILKNHDLLKFAFIHIIIGKIAYFSTFFYRNMDYALNL